MAIWDRFFGNSVSTAAGYGIGSALGPALNPLTQDVANKTWALHPDVPLTPEQVAEAEVRAALGDLDAHDEAAKSGTDSTRYDVLHALAGEPPSPQQLLELWNRGLLGEADVERGFRQGRLRPEWYTAVKRLRNVLVPVSDLVRFAVREVFDPAQRAALDLDADYPDALTPEAAKLGLSDTDAKRYWAAHWNLPSYEQLANMRFRGLLTEAQFENALRAADYAPTWRGKLAEIARAIPGVSDMVRFAVREVYDPAKRRALDLDAEYPAEFTAQAAKHGLSEQDARDYWAAHWNLPSATQGYQMLWRDELDEAGLDGLLKALDYAPTWRDKLRNIAYHVPGRIDLRRMYAEKIINRAELKHGYKRLGYNDADAETLTEFAVKLAEKPSATDASPHVTKANNQLWTTTHRSYIAAEIDDATTLASLADAGVPADERPDVLTTWKNERELIRKQLTPANIAKGFKKGAVNDATGQPWTHDEAIDALVQRGYSVSDARSYLNIATA